MYGQEPVGIVRSDKTEVIDGKKFYLHEVKQGQTIYSICKAYEVEQSDVALVNPEIFEGLKPGQIIKIPVKADTNKQQYLTHKAEKGETLYGISKKYNVSVDDLMKWNPELKEGLKTGQDIKVQMVKETSAVTQTLPQHKPDTAYPARPAFHVVKDRETLYAISRQYNMAVAEIETHNPRLKETGLRSGDTLIINTALYKPASGNTSAYPHLLFPSQNTGECIPQPMSRPVRIGLILPFSHDARTMEKEELKLEKDPNLIPQVKPYIEYYEGFLIALDTLKNRGVQVELSVFDSHRDSTFIAELVQSGKLSQLDMIIGPVFQKEYNLVAEYCLKNAIWSVYPINSQNPELSRNPYSVQMNPSFESQISQAIKYMASYMNKNYIVVYGDSPEEKNFVKFYQKQLSEAFKLNFPSLPLPYNEVLYSEKGMSGIEKVLKDTSENVIILTSGNQAFILDMLNRLNNLSKTKKIVLTMMPQWKKFEKNIEFDHLFNMQAVSFAPFYADPRNPLVAAFNKEYNSRYNMFPGEYSYLGYDAGLYLTTLLYRYGKDFGPCINYDCQGLLQTDYYFERDSNESGLENRTLFFIKCVITADDTREYKVTGKIKDKVIPVVQE
jgi:LysM repeat protein/ABC-type branched-subunit amino acid transport system substrate-binding protein